MQVPAHRKAVRVNEFADIHVSTLQQLELDARIAWLLTPWEEGIGTPPMSKEARGFDGTVIQVAFDYDEQGARRWRYYGVIPGDTEPVDLSREQAAAMLEGVNA
jgi:hypothetical protein